MVTSRILGRCVQIAQRLDRHRGLRCNHISFVVQNRTILGYGQNRPESPVIGSGYRSRHSETEAWRRSRRLLTRDPFDVVNLRLGPVGQLMIAAPCHRCQQFLAARSCRTVHFTTEGGRWARLDLG